MLSLTSPLAIPMVIAVAAAVATLLLRIFPYFAKLVASGGARLGPMDGLRGFLALGVMMHHTVFNYCFGVVHVWTMPASPYFLYLGGGSVALFFMTSGYLFWSRALDGKLQPAQLYVSRFWRIVPLYLAMALTLGIIVGFETHWKLLVPRINLVREVAFWLCGGFYVLPSLNGALTYNINSGVTWSLVYEWWFYLFLPFLTVFVPVRRFVVTVVPFFIFRHYAAVYFPEYAPGAIVSGGFAFGMISAYLCRVQAVRHYLARRTFAVLSLAYLAVCFIYNVRHPTNPLTNEVMGFPLFLMVACGNNFFRILTRPWAVLLGHLSYSIYLFHGFVLWALVQKRFAPSVLAKVPPLHYWGWVVGVAVPAVVVLSALTYRFIEAPFLAKASTKSA